MYTCKRNIKLVRYRKYTNDFILFEHLNAPVLSATKLESTGIGGNSAKVKYRTLDDEYQMASESIKMLYDSIVDYIRALGDDITENKLQLWIAFKKVKNFACIVIKQSYIKVYLNLPTSDVLEQDQHFIRDVSKVGHWGTGDVEITIKDEIYFEKAKLYLDKAYHAG